LKLANLDAKCIGCSPSHHHGSIVTDKRRNYTSKFLNRICSIIYKPTLFRNSYIFLACAVCFFHFLNKILTKFDILNFADIFE